jgi:hypothetical protein
VSGDVGREYGPLSSPTSTCGASNTAGIPIREEWTRPEKLGRASARGN